MQSELPSEMHPDGKSRESCAIIIPVFNEEHAILGTIDRLKKIVTLIPNFEFEFICIDDGSVDQTPEI